MNGCKKQGKKQLEEHGRSNTPSKYGCCLYNRTVNKVDSRKVRGSSVILDHSTPYLTRIWYPGIACKDCFPGNASTFEENIDG